MVSRLVKVEFVEQSKAVTANVKIEYTDPDKSNEDILREAEQLFNEANKFSISKTMAKLN